MSRQQRLDSTTAELQAMGVSTHPGRGWRVLALLVVVGAATFLAAYYLPLYRAHDQLRNEYAKLSKAATSDRQKLADTVQALQSVSSRRDELEGQRRTAEKQRGARTARVDRVTSDLETRLASAIAKKLVRLEPQGEALNVLMVGSAFFARSGEELSARGKKLLCLVASSAGPLRYEVRALASSAAAGGTPGAGAETAWALASSTASTLAESCKVDLDEIVLRASRELPQGRPSAPLVVSLTAGSDSPQALPSP
jgi:chemotaxis protein MotB